MVVAVKPGRFYGSSLPRPRIYTDVKLNKERVDPPMPVLEPFLSWANDAHWSMGGLSFKRLRLQGRIEGRIQKFRSARDDDGEDPKKKKAKTAAVPAVEEPTRRYTRQRLAALDSSSESEEDGEAERERESGDDDDALGGGSGLKRKRARKLSDEFDKVASASVSPRAENGGKKKSSSALGERMSAVASRVQTRRSERGREMQRAEVNGNVRRKVVASKKKSPSKGKQK